MVSKRNFVNVVPGVVQRFQGLVDPQTINQKIVECSRERNTQYARKRTRAFLWEKDLLYDPAEEGWERDKLQIASSKFLFCDGHSSMKLPSPTGVVILSVPLLSVCKLFPFVCTCFAPCKQRLYQTVDQGRIHPCLLTMQILCANNWHRHKNPAVLLPGLNVRIVPGGGRGGLKQNLLESTAKAPLLPRGFVMHS